MKTGVMVGCKWGCRLVWGLKRGVFCALLAVLGLWARPLSAQVVSLSESATAAGLTKWVEKDPNLSKDDRERMLNFVANYAAYAPKMGAENAEMVASICALAQDRQLRFYPDIYLFLKAQHYIDTALYAWGSDWLLSLESALKQHKTRDFSRIIERTLGLLVDKQMVASARATWTVLGGQPMWNGELGTRGAFRYEDLTLLCTAYNDSSLIYSASGYYDPISQFFYGEVGTVDWKRTGVETEGCYAIIHNYKINLSGNRYESDSAFFHNPSLSDKTIPGRFAEKLSVLTDNEPPTYPQFYSGSTHLKLPDFFPGLDVEAPYVQQGARMIFGTEDHMAKLYVRHDEQGVGMIESPRIVYKDNKLQSTMASWCIYLGENDSIYHQTSEMRYDIKQRMFTFSHSQLFAIEIPALSTYHQISLQFEHMQWYPMQNKVEFGLLRVPEREGDMRIASTQMYEETELEDIMQGMPYNPLYRLKKSAAYYGTNVISLDVLAEDWGVDKLSLSQWMLRLSSYGFLTYRAKHKEIELLPKLYLYLAVGAEKSDFDRIEIVSSGKAWVKALLRTDSLTIALKEVEEVMLSPKQRVYFRPNNGVLTIGRNRDIYFNGLLHAGTFDFDVRDARFSYEDFTVHIGMVDSLLFSVPGKIDSILGTREEIKVSTLIHNLSGILYIDSNANKGGRLDCPEFPIFESTIPSYVYYNDAFIQNGAYPSDIFYFEVDPFRLLRLNTFSVDSINFPGTMVSGGIFPDFRERLVVMPDFSLGFKTVSPEEGWPTYGGLALFTDSVRLDKRGLVGKGRFDFLSSQTLSNALYFRPKNMNMVANRFEQDVKKYPVNTGTEYPHLTADTVKAFFDVAEATLSLTTNPRHALYPYYEPWRFGGVYTFSAEKSEASGEMYYGGDATIKAPVWRWDEYTFAADSADFQLGGRMGSRLGGKDAYLIAQGVGVTANVNDKVLQMQAVGADEPTEPIKVQMPVQSYEAETYSLRWSWADEQLYLEQQLAANADGGATEGEDIDSVGLTLRAVAKSQVGLQFNALHSTLYYRDTLLTSEGVTGLRVADAYFVPSDGKVSVLPNGRLEQIKKATLSFSDAYPAYEFYDVKSNIQSAWSYTADGWYDYEAPGLEPRPIHFTRIQVRKIDSTSEAVAEIGEDYLFLDKGFEFTGRITASAREAALRESTDMHFDGMAGLRYRLRSTDGTESEVDWFSEAFKFRDYLNPEDIRIPVTDQTKSGRGRPMRSGFFSSSDGRPHFVFMEPVLSTDKAIASAEGYLRYSEEDKSYLIVDDKDNEILAYDLEKGESSATGTLKLDLNTGDVKTAFYGQLYQEGTEANDLFMQAVFKLDFFFNAPLFKRMADELNKNTSLSPGNLTDNPMFDVFLEESMTSQERLPVKKDLQAYGSLPRIPSAWQKGLLFSNLGFEWDANASAYRSTGSGEVLMVGPHWINKKMKVYVQINRGRRGDILNMYIEGSRYNWYYFNIADNKMQMLSSDPTFNEMIEKLKASKRRKKRFEFMLSTMRKKNIFVAEFEGAIEAEDEPAPAPTQPQLQENATQTQEGYNGYEDWSEVDDGGDEGVEEGAEESTVEEGATEDGAEDGATEDEGEGGDYYEDGTYEDETDATEPAPVSPRSLPSGTATQGR